MATKIKVEAKDRAPLASRPWTAHYDEGVPATLVYPKVPLQAMLDDAAEGYPEATATIFFNAKRSYRSVSDDAWRFANGLRRRGIRKGDRVALMLPNTPQFVIAFYGALRAGAVVVPCNPLYTPPELQHQLADSGAKAIVVLSRLYPVVTAARAGTAVEHVIVTNIKEEMPPVLRLLFTLAREKKDGHRVPFRGDSGAIAWREVLSAPGDPFEGGATSDDLAVLQYTGGTTGISKGAMLSHRALVASALQCRAFFTNLRDGQDTVMAVMPFFHVYGLSVIMGLSVQAAAAMILEPQFDLVHVLKDVQRHRPAIFCAVPRIYNAINVSGLATKYDLRSIEACICSAAPLLLETHRKFVELTGANLVEGYGLTEAASGTHCNPMFGRGKQKVGSIGVPAPDLEAKIVDLDSGERELDVGEAGELVVRGPQLMDGYYQGPEETALTLRDGWLYTGDIATVDAEGYFAIVDRKKELIIVSGFNVYPREVEEALATHPAILDAAAIGVPHPIKGEEVKAFVVLKPGASATADEIVAHCRMQLAPFKLPKEVEFRESLPKTLIGKTLRRQLAQEEMAKRAMAVGAEPRRADRPMKVAYEVTGTGAPVVLLHGILASADMWTEQVRALASRYRVITIDARGHGRSPHATTPFTIADMVDDAVGVLDELGIERAVWGGLSMGGMVALSVAVRAPRRVRALMLLDTDAGPAGLGDRIQYRVMSVVAAAVGVRPLVSRIIAMSLGATTRRRRPDVVADWRARFLRAHVPSGRQAIRAVAGREDLRGRLREIAVPTLVIVGEEDPTFPPPVSRTIASGIPGAQLVVIPRSGHVTAAEQPEAVARAMLSFLDVLPPAQ